MANLLGDFDEAIGGFPADVEFGAGGGGVFEGDGHDLLRARDWLRHHGNAAEIFVDAVLGAPLIGLLVDNQQPLVFAGIGVESMGAGWDEQVAEVEIGGGGEGGGGVSAGAPPAAVGNQATHDLAATHGGGVVGDTDPGIAEAGGGGCGGAGERLV